MHEKLHMDVQRSFSEYSGLDLNLEALALGFPLEALELFDVVSLVPRPPFYPHLISHG